MTQLQPTDVNKYITTIRINFENAYKTQTDEEREILIKSWFAILKDYPKEVCDRAVINALANAEYAPRIGSIVKEIEKMQVAFEKSETELWSELTGVFREVERCAYAFRYTAIDYNGKTQGENARIRINEIFNGLSPELKEYCRNANGLIDLARSEGLEYEKGRFMRVIPQMKERARVRQSTPDGLAGLVQGLATQFTLGCDGTKLLQGD
jgi:hypothetical protein